MNLGSQRMMKMGYVVREPLHGLAAQLREAAIFEGEPFSAPLFPNTVFSSSPLGVAFLLKLPFFLAAYIGTYEFSAFSLFAP
jgi:hypothetical protein